MRPSYLKVTGFLAFQNTLEFNFDNLSAAMITGQNATGKSSFIVDAMQFALYGKARTKSDNLINHNCSVAEVVYAFTYKQSYYQITRILQRGKPGKLILLQDNVDVSERLLSNTQDKLEQIINVSQSLLLSVAVAQQDNINTFTDYNPSKRAELLTELLDLQTWEKKKLLINDLIKQADTVYTKIQELRHKYQLNEGNTSILRVQIEQKNTELLLLQNKDIELQQQLDNYVDTITVISKLQQQLAEVKGRYSAMLKQAEQYSVVQKINIKDIIDKIEDITKAYDRQQEVNACSARKVEQIRSELLIVQRTLSTAKLFLSNHNQSELLNIVPCKDIPDLVNTCNLLENARKQKSELEQYLAKWQVTSIHKLIEFLESQETKQQQELQLANAQHNNDINAVGQLYMSLQQAQIVKDKVIAKEQLQKEIDATVIIVNQLQKEIDALPNVQNEVNITSLRNDKQRISLQLQNINNEHTTLNTTLNLLLKDNISCNNQIQELQPLIENLPLLKILQNAYTEIPNLLFYQVVPLIEEYANNILDDIMPEHRLQLRVYKETKANTQQRTLDLISTSPAGDTEFSNLSGSEKFRLSLALRLALVKASAEIHGTPIATFIVDEAFGCLDEVNISIIKTTLQKVATYFDLFLVITHVPELKDTFETEIHLNKPGPKISIINHVTSLSVTLDN